MRFWELSDHEVINCKDGKRLGQVGDIEINLHNCTIEALFIPKGNKYCGCIGKKFEIRVPMDRVVKIGVDIILVDIDEKKCILGESKK